MSPLSVSRDKMSIFLEAFLFLLFAFSGLKLPGYLNESFIRKWQGHLGLIFSVLLVAIVKYYQGYLWKWDYGPITIRRSRRSAL